MTRARAASAAWTTVLVVCATLALIGTATFMNQVHRGTWWSRPDARAPGAALPPAGEPSRGVASASPDRRPLPDTTDGAALPPGAGVTAETAVALLRTRRLTLPVAGQGPSDLVPSFAEARGDRVHEAIDIMAPAGTPVIAVEDGSVAKLFTSVAGGLTIYQFDPTRRVAYYYAHLQGYAPGLSDGVAVRRGEVIGYVGNTGNADPAAPHLHFAIVVLGPDRRWWEGTPIDPFEVLR